MTPLMEVNLNEAWCILVVLIISFLRELRPLIVVTRYCGLIEHPQTFGWPGYRRRCKLRSINTVKAFLAFPTPFLFSGAQFKGSCKFINARLGFLSFSVTLILHSDHFSPTHRIDGLVVQSRHLDWARKNMCGLWNLLMLIRTKIKTHF